MPGIGGFRPSTPGAVEAARKHFDAHVAAALPIEGARRKRTDWLVAVTEPFVRDVRASLDPTFRLSWLAFQDDGWMRWEWIAEWDDGFWAYGGSLDDEDLDDETPAELLARLAWDIPDNVFDDVREPWPECPRHPGQLLYPDVRNGRAVWECREDAVVVSEIGSFVRAP